MHANCKLIVEKYFGNYISESDTVLEIGPDAVPSTIRKKLSSLDVTWDYLDIREYPGLTYVNQAPYNFSIEDNSYDVIIACQVTEHVEQIWKWLQEVERICKKGGRIIILSPVSWPYHESPVDCWRIYPAGMRALVENFTKLEIDTCFFESLEMEGYKNKIPSISPYGQPNWKRIFYKYAGRFGFPVECAFDMLTVLVK